MKQLALFFAFVLLISCKDDSADTECIITDPTNQPCTYHYDPVCGCDGKTYGNSCTAESAGVMTYTSGQCD